MFQSPVSETKESPAAGKPRSVQRFATELHPHFGGVVTSGYPTVPASRALSNRPSLRHLALAKANSTYGNQTVLRMLNHTTNSSRLVLQRKCACAGSGGDCAKCNEKEETALQRRAGNHTEPNSVPPIVHEVLNSAGQPLDATTRAFMEPRFGYDFSQVQIHTDARATESARAVNALAYTVGKHVVFGAGQYAPKTSEGRKVLAHELTHTLQQRAGVNGMQSKLSIGRTNDASELEADQVAENINASGGLVPSHLLSRAPLLQRTCGSTGIGTPAGCAPQGPTFVTGGSLFKFRKDCDDFEPASEETALQALPTTPALPASATVQIHGYASDDGDAAFNESLSCARALKAQSVLAAGGLAASRITGIFQHGGTPGPVVDRRSVVILPTTPAPAAPVVTTHRFRVAGLSFLSCAECNPFTDDGLLGVTPPTAEPPLSSSFRQMHQITAELGSADGRTIAPSTARLISSGNNVGISHFCGSGAPAHIVSSGPPGAPVPISDPVHGDGIQLQSVLTSRVGASVPATLPGSPCGPLGTNPMIPVIGNTFRLRLFADGTKESEFLSGTLYPSHHLYEDGALKLFGGAPVHPRQDFHAWASSTVPLAIGLVGFKALRFHCCHPVISGAACDTNCVGGFSVPGLLFSPAACAVHGAAVASASCPTACAPAGGSCTPIVRGSNP